MDKPEDWNPKTGADAIKAWFEADFTWEALKQKIALEYDSLQSYWIRLSAGQNLEEMVELGEVIESPGQPTYHIVHLPLYYADGSPTLKSSYSWESNAKLYEMAIRALRTAASSANGPTAIYTESNRAMLTGAVLPNADLTFEATQCSIHADFSGALFPGEACFDNAIFASKSDFYGAAFSHSSFNDTTFQAAADFGICQFSGPAFFIRAAFHGIADFDGARFEEKLSFRSARFISHAIFTQLGWPEDASDHSEAFDQTTFADTADFRDNDPPVFGAFDGTRFKEGLKFDNIPEPDAKEIFKRELWPEQFAIRKKGFLSRYARHVFTIRFLNRWDEFDRPEYELRTIENSCRVLKQEMAKISEKAREHLFYQFELMARREQRATSLTEFLASLAYEYVSDYGSSIVRPIIAMGIGLFGFAILYWFLFAHGVHDVANILREPFVADHWDNALLATEVSASRMFPFGAFGLISTTFAQDINGNGRPVSAMIFMFLATFQSILTVILTFLIGLAIRRRFQMS